MPKQLPAGATGTLVVVVVAATVVLEATVVGADDAGAELSADSSAPLDEQLARTMTDTMRETHCERVLKKRICLEYCGQLNETKWLNGQNNCTCGQLSLLANYRQVETVTFPSYKQEALGGDVKKLMGIVIAGVALVGFAACGGDDEAEVAEVVDKSAIVLLTEEVVAGMGQTLDVDCAIKAYSKMSEADVAIMLENVQGFADPEADPAALGLTADGVSIVEEVVACIAE